MLKLHSANWFVFLCVVNIYLFICSFMCVCECERMHSVKFLQNRFTFSYALYNINIYLEYELYFSYLCLFQ